jgi:hypothetical protein
MIGVVNRRNRQVSDRVLANMPTKANIPINDKAFADQVLIDRGGHRVVEICDHCCMSVV